MSAIAIPQRGGLAAILAWLRTAVAGQPALRGERADGVAGACALDRAAETDAGALFARCLREQSNLEQDWLWLSTMVTGEAELHYCLERALYINPRSEEARRELARLARRRP